MSWYKLKTQNGYSKYIVNYHFKILQHIESTDHIEYIEEESLGWFVYWENKKLDRSYNSLSDGLYFSDLENAKSWCERFVELDRGKGEKYNHEDFYVKSVVI